MDSLRFILLLGGFLLIAGLYLSYRLKQGGNSLNLAQLKKVFHSLLSRFSFTKEALGSKAVESRILEDEATEFDFEELPSLSAVSSEQVDTDSFGPIPAFAEEQAGSGEDLTIVLSIMAKQGKAFNGLDVLDALLAKGFIHGQMNIFHYFAKEAQTDKRPVCSVANAVEPGNFDLDNIEALRTPGLCLFMQLPGPLQGRDAFETMLELGRVLAEHLQGDLCDEKRNVLTMQATGHLKEKIEAWLFKQKMAHVHRHHH